VNCGPRPCLFDVGFPRQGSRTGLTPTISYAMPGTPARLRLAPLSSRRNPQAAYFRLARWCTFASRTGRTFRFLLALEALTQTKEAKADPRVSARSAECI
jgi:hypothetical protein